ncbi:unnamed protein product [Vicia faba]|uniref:BTB domain-containing protein n=1 Tax=Vicia faba TaxID=3906 RepID=A0AAV0YQ10_VICFA|nr:unnamed protein product [Vicia faba]
MDNSNEASSSLSFVSSHISNGSSNTHNEHVANIEIVSLNKLSGSLEKLLSDVVDYDYCDAEIVVEEIPVGIHRCILASRSQFFHELFKKGKDGDLKDGKGTGKPSYQMKDLVCYACIHDSCRPAIDYALELIYASSTFQMKELVLLFQRYLLNFVDKALVEDVIPILVAANHCQLDQLLSHCIQRVARSDMDIISLERELPYEVMTEIKSLRVQSLPESSPDAMEVEPVIMNDKSIRKILKALDSDDVELLKLLLDESSVTLDDAYALHYACAYSDSKVVQEVLTLGLADILLKNPRGYTVLHVAARRKDPSILCALLKKGACASETTLDGQTALSICQRLTRRKDYNMKTVQGKESHKDRLCVDVLEREMRRNSMSVDMSVLSQLTADDLNMRLDYLENRVAFARLFFPAEARVAIENAEADSTPLYATLSALKGNIKEVDLNETPSFRTRKLQLRLQSLVKTVENGRRFFPHCSEVLDKYLEDEMPDVHVLEKGTEEEQRTKKARFMELRDEVQKAFHKDMAENNHSHFSSSLTSTTSSSTRRESLNHKVRRK